MEIPLQARAAADTGFGASLGVLLLIVIRLAKATIDTWTVVRYVGG